MLEFLKFKFGSAKDGPALRISSKPSITIFVGPNNSGKSQALREIANFFSHGENVGGVIIDEVKFLPLDSAGANSLLQQLSTPRNQGEYVVGDAKVLSLQNGSRIQVQEANFLNSMINPYSTKDTIRQFSQWYASSHLLSLDGPSRMGLVHSQARDDLKKPNSSFAKLLVDDVKRKELRELLFDATGMYFVLDASEGNQINVKFGENVPPNERSLEDETLEYMRNARGIDKISDGIKAFTGILLQVHVGRPSVITVDEPEAFLHPSLAFKLGKELARGAVEERKQIFASTHSSQFLMGAISSGADVNIIRLTYSGGIGAARLLPSDELAVLMRDPLLRSVGVLDGLFFDSVLVGEANADRAFYQEINERLLAKGDWRGSPRTLFLNADNKQTIPRIVRPLRSLGIPAAGVVDIDVLKDGGIEWSRQLEAIGIPSIEQSAYANRRNATLTSLNQSDPKFKTSGGIFVLKGPELEAANNLLADLARYGLFVVPSGEIESWLPALDVPRSKNAWLRNIFEKMGSDPAAADYVMPDEGDVWDFVGEISKWMQDRKRRGIPV